MLHRCKVPDFEAFDIDVHDCPCGHPYGEHDYDYRDARMIIKVCLRCAPAAREIKRLSRECERAFEAYQEAKEHELSLPACDRAFKTYAEARREYGSLHAHLHSRRTD